MIRGLVLLGLGLGLLGAACGSHGLASSAITITSPASTGLPPIGASPSLAPELVALAGTVGAMHLVQAGLDGRLDPAARGTPADAAWLSSDGSALVVTTLDGRLILGRAAPSGERIAWMPAPGDPGAAHPTRAFGTLEPAAASTAGEGDADGDPQDRRVAVVEGDPGSGGPGRLVVLRLADGASRARALPMSPESAAAWLPDGRVVVIVRDRTDRPATLLVDPTTGAARPGPSGRLRTVAIAGGLVAGLADDGTLRVGTVAAWLAGTLAAPSLELAPDEAIVQAQPSPAGDELALVIADPAGDAASIRLLATAMANAASTGAWHEIARFSLPNGANRAVASWLVAR